MACCCRYVVLLGCNPFVVTTLVDQGSAGMLGDVSFSEACQHIVYTAGGRLSKVVAVDVKPMPKARDRLARE